MNSRINETLNADHTSEKLEKFYEETYQKLQEAMKRVAEYKEKAEGFIAISEYRDEKRKLSILSRNSNKPISTFASQANNPSQIPSESDKELMKEIVQSSKEIKNKVS